MTSGNTRIRPLSEPQERRLLDYLDEKYREVHQEYSKRHEPASKLPTLRAYLDSMRSLLALTLQVPPVAPSGMLRISLLLRLTNTVVEDVPGYSPDSTDLVPLLKWLDLLDRGWFSVLSMQAWDPVRGEGVDLPQHLLEKIPPATQTDRTRVHSLLVTGTSTLEDWMEGKREDSEDSLVHDMRRLGHQSAFDELFHRTLTRLRELESGEEDDEEELLARLPSWDSLCRGSGRRRDGLNEGRVDTGGSDDDMEEAVYDNSGS
ncbi:hypothetical protein EDB84DRAFT_1404096 [Lactarius hengduanensis]|nr:hypothetical protein EDB84DRAFT_1404096 [Lactarius hengduanensis]